MACLNTEDPSHRSCCRALTLPTTPRLCGACGAAVPRTGLEPRPACKACYNSWWLPNYCDTRLPPPSPAMAAPDSPLRTLTPVCERPPTPHPRQPSPPTTELKRPPALSLDAHVDELGDDADDQVPTPRALDDIPVLRREPSVRCQDCACGTRLSPRYWLAQRRRQAQWDPAGVRQYLVDAHGFHPEVLRAVRVWRAEGLDSHLLELEVAEADLEIVCEQITLLTDSQHCLVSGRYQGATVRVFGRADAGHDNDGMP